MSIKELFFCIEEGDYVKILKAEVENIPEYREDCNESDFTGEYRVMKTKNHSVEINTEMGKTLLNKSVDSDILKLSKNGILFTVFVYDSNVTIINNRNENAAVIKKAKKV